MRNHNRRYKDSVFVDLFSEDVTAKDNFLSLYNALHGTDYHSTGILKKLRLKQVMYMTFTNDVSYLVDNKIIVLAEHQSTMNENMPLRCLEYVTRLYEQIQKPRVKYYRTLYKIPMPEFYVFYNGKEQLPANQVLKLSDAFTVQTETPNLELIVQLMNINYDKGNQVLQRCKALQQYSLFVHEVRRHIAVDRKHGFEKAIRDCIQNNILKEYLQRKAKEVMNMLIGEYDYNTDIAVQREESFDCGLAEGEIRGSRQAKLETAAAFKRLGIDIAKIAEGTGLSCEEIEKL